MSEGVDVYGLIAEAGATGLVVEDYIKIAKNLNIKQCLGPVRQLIEQERVMLIKYPIPRLVAL